MKNFKEINRYGDYHEFINVKDNIYHIKPLYDMLRIIFENDNKEGIYAVDPDGGPFMVRGTVLDCGKTVKDIYYDENKEITFVIE